MNGLITFTHLRMIGQIVHTETEIKTTPNYPGNTTAQPAISVKPAWIWPLHEYDSHQTVGKVLQGVPLTQQGIAMTAPIHFQLEQHTGTIEKVSRHTYTHGQEKNVTCNPHGTEQCLKCYVLATEEGPIGAETSCCPNKEVCTYHVDYA